MMMTREGSIAEKAVQDIINLIMSKELVPGDKLPSERDLADMLGVGRPAVREALKIADAFGIVNIKQYDGLYVAGAEPEKLSTPFKLRMDMGQFDLVQLFEMRRIFEVETIKLAAARITDEEIENLERIMKSADVNDAEQFAASDSEFHSAIYRATGNAFLVMIMQIINELSSLSRRITGRFEETRHIVHSDHLNILDALKRRDIQQCGEGMLQHINHLQKIIEIDTKVYESVFQRQLKEMMKDE